MAVHCIGCAISVQSLHSCWNCVTRTTSRSGTMQKLPARLDWTAHSSEREIQLLPRGLNIYQDKTKWLCHGAGCHSEVEKEGNSMSLDQWGPREPKMQLFGSPSPELFVMWWSLAMLRTVVRAVTNKLCFLSHSVCNPQNILNSEQGHTSVTKAAV